MPFQKLKVNFSILIITQTTAGNILAHLEFVGLISLSLEFCYYMAKNNSFSSHRKINTIPA